MRLYTRSGDAGETGLIGGARVRKDDARVEAGGAVDEANAALGVCRAAAGLPAGDAELLGRLQADLLRVGADLAAAQGERAGSIARLVAADVSALEAEIDRCSAALPELHHFILPAGSAAAAALHVARTTVRRAERACVALAALAPVNAQALAYLNRLSDLLFALARRANVSAGLPEEPWIPSR